VKSSCLLEVGVVVGVVIGGTMLMKNEERSQQHIFFLTLTFSTLLKKVNIAHICATMAKHLNVLFHVLKEYNGTLSKNW